MWGKRIMSALAICLALGATAQAQSRDEVLPAAVEALKAGDSTRALALSDSLIAANPRDIDALLLKSEIHFAMGQSRSAREAATAAFTASDIPAARYASGMRIAELHALDGNYPLSQFWLRQAGNYAANDEQLQRAVAAYRNVRARNPWRFTFSGGVAPNSNINNGSSETTMEIFGLPFVLSPTARALSGYTAEAQAKLDYRIFQTERSQTTVGIEAAGRMNWLDRASAAAAPTVSGHDYDFYSLALTATHQQIVGNGIRLEFSGRAGRNWYGGAKLSDFFGAGTAVTFPLFDGRDALTFSARADRSLLVQGGLVPETVATIGAAYAHKLAWGDTVIGRVNYTRSWSAGASQVYTLPSAGIDYRFSRPILGAYLEVGGNYGYKSYNFSPFSTTGRQDRILSGHVSAEFRNFSYMGFSPVVTMEAKRSWSNVPLYSQTSFTGGLSFQSRF
jgi:tetratricopeptide (TPR) repeat protein